ncbi:MAG: hypothetical protein QNJ20_14580 [Paracoccaceae bacterium]|nr:hypothetical protein [Paracoccaceae bacterium]
MTAAPEEQSQNPEVYFQSRRPRNKPLGGGTAEVPSRERGNSRVTDRIRVQGFIHFEGFDYAIHDLSVGGLSVFGAVLGWQEDEIRQAEFALNHGSLEVRGKMNCLCLDNPENGISRFKLVDPSEDLAEFFRAATLRSVSGADYDVGWLPESSSKLKSSETIEKASLASHVFSLPMLVLAMFVVLLAAFAIRKTNGDAHWVTGTHEIIAPVTGQITSLGTGPFTVGETLAEITAMTVNGNDLPFNLTADVASVAVDWRFSTGDRIGADDVLGHLHNVPRNKDRFFAIVSLQIPFYRPVPGDRVVLEAIDDTRIVGDLQRLLTRDQARNHATNNGQFAPNKPYALVEFQGAPVDFSAAPEVRILDTLIENTFR